MLRSEQLLAEVTMTTQSSECLRRYFTIASILCQRLNKRFEGTLVAQVGHNLLQTIPLLQSDIAQCQLRCSLDMVLAVALQEKLELRRRKFYIPSQKVIHSRAIDNLYCGTSILMREVQLYCFILRQDLDNLLKRLVTRIARLLEVALTLLRVSRI